MPLSKTGGDGLTFPGKSCIATSRTAKSSRVEDNSFLPSVLYSNETTPLSLHFGELRLPDFFGDKIGLFECRHESGAPFLARTLLREAGPFG
jgi:hypothetical protein